MPFTATAAKGTACADSQPAWRMLQLTPTMSTTGTARDQNQPFLQELRSFASILPTLLVLCPCCSPAQRQWQQQQQCQGRARHLQRLMRLAPSLRVLASSPPRGLAHSKSFAIQSRETAYCAPHADCSPQQTIPGCVCRTDVLADGNTPCVRLGGSLRGVG